MTTSNSEAVTKFLEDNPNYESTEFQAVVDHLDNTQTQIEIAKNIVDNRRELRKYVEGSMRRFFLGAYTEDANADACLHVLQNLQHKLSAKELRQAASAIKDKYYPRGARRREDRGSVGQLPSGLDHEAAVDIQDDLRAMFDKFAKQSEEFKAFLGAEALMQRGQGMSPVWLTKVAEKLGLAQEAISTIVERIAAGRIKKDSRRKMRQRHREAAGLSVPEWSLAKAAVLMSIILALCIGFAARGSHQGGRAVPTQVCGESHQRAANAVILASHQSGRAAPAPSVVRGSHQGNRATLSVCA